MAVTLNQADLAISAWIARGAAVRVAGLAGTAVVLDYAWHGSALTVKVGWKNRKGRVVSVRQEPAANIIRVDGN